MDFTAYTKSPSESDLTALLGRTLSKVEALSPNSTLRFCPATAPSPDTVNTTLNFEESFLSLDIDFTVTVRSSLLFIVTNCLRVFFYL